MKESARCTVTGNRAGSAPYQSAFRGTVNPAGSGVDSRPSRLGRGIDGNRLFRGGHLRGGRLGNLLGKREGERDFLGDGGLLLADADLPLEGRQRRLETLRLDRQAQHIARPANPVTAHTFAGGEENGPMVDGLPRLA